MRFFVIAILFWFLPLTIVCAQSSSTFNVRMYGGVDVTAPTTPTVISVTPITTSQIDLVWSTSTDDVVLGGYNVFRDGSVVATTTQLTYSDTGLMASTTYTYAVRSYDTSSNYSSTSNSIATTTLPVAVVTPTTTATSSNTVSADSGTMARSVLDTVRVVADTSRVNILLQTTAPARLEVRWGRSASYELGYVVSSIFRREHDILLTDLEPGTAYEYEVLAYTPSGVETVLKRGIFTTLSPDVTTTPENVSQFAAVSDGADVRLSWQLPTETDIAWVRIVRSHLGFPQHPHDGAIVYQGIRERAIDVEALAHYSPLYYTAFVYNTAGVISSGAVASVFADSVSAGSGSSTFPAKATTTILSERVTPETKLPDLLDIVVKQRSRQYTLVDPNIELDLGQSFRVVVPRTAIAGNLKTIILRVVNPTNPQEESAYLMRINHDQTVYEAVVPSLRVMGASWLRVEVYDYEAMVAARYESPVTFLEIDTQEESVVFPDLLIGGMKKYWLLLFLLPVVPLLLLVRRQRQAMSEDNL